MSWRVATVMRVSSDGWESRSNDLKTTCHKQGLVLSSQALHGNPYDGYTMEHAAETTGRSIQKDFVDKGYKKHGVEAVKIIMSGQGKLSRSLKKALRRRNAVEPHIGHMKTEGKLGRNYLKETFGDKINALLVAIGHNLRLILNYIRSLLTFMMLLIARCLFTPNHKIKTT